MIDATDITTADLWLPADVLGGAVLTFGLPVHKVWHSDVVDGKAIVDFALDGVYLRDLEPDPAGRRCRCFFDDPRIGVDTGFPPRILCTIPALRDRLRRVLAAGERCLCPFGVPCAIDGCDKRPGHVGPHSMGNTHPACQQCRGTGYTRQPADIGPIIDAEIRGDITPGEAAALVWVSVARVDVGMEPARGLQEPTRPGRYTAVCGRMRLGTGSEGDGDVVSDAYALRVDGALLLPHPDGVRRLVLS